MLSFTILFQGCASLHLPEYKPQTIDRYPHAQVKDGLAIAANPLIDKEEVVKYFGADLLSLDVLPVLVVAENRSLSSSFVLSKEQFSLKGGKLLDETARRQIAGQSGSLAPT